MELTGAIERLQHTVQVCGSPDAALPQLRDALRATTELQAFIAARRAELVTAVDAHPAAFPEAAIAETSGCSLRQAAKEKERADTLVAAAAMADALSDGAITPAHVDVLTRVGRRLEPAGKFELLDLDEAIAATAATTTIGEFDAWLTKKARELDQTDADDRLDRQRRASRLRHWFDSDDGMWNVRGRFDPQTGRDLARLIDGATDRIKRGDTPTTAPIDPIERVQHLAAIAFADLVRGAVGTTGRTGPPLAVIDATQTTTLDANRWSGPPVIDWGYPIELPTSVLAELAGTTDPDVVVVANGLVLHAAGRLDLGRTTRLANRAQRRALSGLYSSCAVPGCSVHYDRCKLHHVVWWRHGGRTDLENLLPVCQHHHTRLHADGWKVTLGPRRELTIEIADGQILRTGPPRRSAA
ncbi:MAG: HNH endonuclease signature motif containing protein [Actinomycetota bacterium]